MKKILIFLFLAYSYSFSASSLQGLSCQVAGVTYAWSRSTATCSGSSSGSYEHVLNVGWKHFRNTQTPINSGGYKCFSTTFTTHYHSCVSTNSPTDPDGFCQGASNYTIDVQGVPHVVSCNESEENYTFVPSPDPESPGQCSEGFVKDGQYYNCNPNTNEAQPVPNSDGYEEDEEGKTYPKCNQGFEGSSTLVVQGGSSHTSQSCVQVAPDTDGDGETENPTTPIPTITTGADGSKSWDSPDGNNYHLTPNGTLTTYYPDGSSSVKQVGGDYVPGSGGGGGGVSGGTSGGTGGTPGTPGTPGTGTDGNTQNELNPTPTPETPIDNTPVANSCNDSALTLQEKLLCEMNAGVKKLNSEGSPQNSLNQLMKDINNDNNTNLTAVNKNIKDTNSLLTSSKSLQENQLKELKDINTNLKNLKISGGTTGDTTTDTTETPLPEDEEGIPNPFGDDTKGFIDGLLGQYTTFKNNIDTQIDTLNNTFNNAKTTFENGVELNLTSSEIVNCPISYTLDMSSFFNKQIPISIDFCEHTSKLKPLLYPVFLILMSLGVVFLAIRFIGVLI